VLETHEVAKFAQAKKIATCQLWQNAIEELPFSIRKIATCL